MLHRHPFLSLLTGGYLVFVGWLTLTPQPIGPDQQDLVVRLLDALHRRGYAASIDYDRLEFLANIGLFVPVGMFLLLLFGIRWWWVAAVVAFLLTAFIESAQRGIPGRVPDGRDLLANTVGGLIGVFVATLLTLPAAIRRDRARLVTTRHSPPRRSAR
ncbi:VanZ family protein [Nocardioides sp. InS609-2]|uniref:VanZ family protein n=1 Tax=Nocardioides sp. InS609-2 TaxID=2760705 RepID=UPI0020BE2AB2|nr:VanZ family protein [Nocardioides sp. InS609-2]